MVGQGLVKETDLTIANDGTGVLWLYNITDTVNTGPDWLTESPDKCRVYADESVNITLTFDATQLDTGDYNAIISIINSDPDENTINVSVNMTVLPPDIWVESTLFEVEVPLNVETVKAFTIGNDGPGLLLFNITDTSGTILLEDDMESGPGEWTHGGDEDEWEYGTPVCGPENAYSGTNCWGTDLDNTYENHTDQWLMTPSMDLSNIDSAILSFHRPHAEPPIAGMQTKEETKQT